MELNKLYNEDCIIGMEGIDSESVDIVLTDPPYLYLKNQKLDRDFDENKFFETVKRILKPNGFIVMFGRGTSFYRWNTRLSELGFEFKEEIIWDKGYCTSPLMALSRVHETISIYTKGKGTINKHKIPYLEMKKNDINAICTDIKRLKTVFGNVKSLEAVKEFLENNSRDTSDQMEKTNITISSAITKENRDVSVMRSMVDGMNEKSIIRTDRERNKNFTKYGVNADIRKSGDRCCNVMQSLEYGYNEKSIIKATRDHYSAIHPTQKPIRLLERLLMCVLPKGTERPFVVDPFAGSGSSLIAAKNIGCQYIGFEIEKEYFAAANERLSNESDIF